MGLVRAARPMKTAILGAGALGLTVAYRLAARGEEVVVLERELRPGGLAAGFEVEPGIWLEKFYHHLFQGDRHAIGLIEELGLGRRPGLAPPADRHPARRARPPAGLAGVVAPLPPAPARRPTPDGRRTGLPAGAAQSRATGGPDRRRLDPPQDGQQRLRGGLGSTPARQVRRAGGGDRHALVLGPRPRPHQPAGLPARWLPAAL